MGHRTHGSGQQPLNAASGVAIPAALLSASKRSRRTPGPVREGLDGEGSLGQDHPIPGTGRPERTLLAHQTHGPDNQSRFLLTHLPIEGLA
jgi:hypothetical protein